jgi:hypothetical protein
VRESIGEHGFLSDAALFVARQWSNPKIPILAVNDFI